MLERWSIHFCYLSSSYISSNLDVNTFKLDWKSALQAGLHSLTATCTYFGEILLDQTVIAADSCKGNDQTSRKEREFRLLGIAQRFLNKIVRGLPDQFQC